MKRRKGIPYMIVGVLLLGAALLLTVYNRMEEKRAGEAASQIVEALGQEIIITDNQEDLWFLTGDMPATAKDGQDYVAMLRIPALEIHLPVINEWDDDKLKTAPCRYKGSAYDDNLIIAGHNYKSHFGELDRLLVGDSVELTDMDGNVFYYEVSGIEELPGTAIKEMESGDWDLTLFTCTYGGQSRVTVRCVRK